MKLTPFHAALGKESHETSPGSHRNLPGRLMHCSKEWQLSVPSRHSSMSTHSPSIHSYPSVHAGSQPHVDGSSVVVGGSVVFGGSVVEVQAPSSRQIHS